MTWNLFSNRQTVWIRLTSVCTLCCRIYKMIIKTKWISCFKVIHLHLSSVCLRSFVALSLFLRRDNDKLPSLWLMFRQSKWCHNWPCALALSSRHEQSFWLASLLPLLAQPEHILLVVNSRRAAQFTQWLFVVHRETHPYQNTPIIPLSVHTNRNSFWKWNKKK